jgi:hypothetical protein
MCAICEFKIEFDVSHPQALAVAVATRQAVEAGRLVERSFDGPLANVKLRVAAIDTLKDLQSRLEEALTTTELMALPDFYVLLIESATWGFFHATESGFDPDIVPEVPDVVSETAENRDIVIVAAEATMRCVLMGEMAFSGALAEKLVLVDVSETDQEHLLYSLDKALALQPKLSQRQPEANFRQS